MNVKKYLKISSSILLLSLMSNVFADPCPPVSKIKKTVFSYALKYGEWSLYSPIFIYHGKKFNVRLDVDMPAVNDADIALNLGQKFFNTASLLDRGTFHLTGHRIRCDYNSETGYGVFAFSPPKTY